MMKWIIVFVAAVLAVFLGVRLAMRRDDSAQAVSYTHLTPCAARQT